MSDKNIDIKKTENIRKLNIFLIQYFNIVAIFIVLAFIVVSIFFVLKPKYDDIQMGIDVSNDNMELEREVFEKYDLRLDGYIASYDRIKKRNRDKISVLLPDDHSKENLFAQFAYMAQKRGLLLNSLTIEVTDVDSIINPKPNARRTTNKNSIILPEGVGTVNINMELTGLDYKSFKDYLSAIENNLRIMDIRDIEYDNSGKKFSVDMTTYFNFFDLLNK